MEYKTEIPRASFRQISQTFTVSFMSCRPANGPVFFLANVYILCHISKKHHLIPVKNWELCLSTWPKHRLVELKAYHCSFITFVIAGAIYPKICNRAITIAQYITVYVSL